MKLSNEEMIMLRILKDYSCEYNANSISKTINLTSMGSLKILKRLLEQKLVKLRKVSNIKFYDFNFENEYAKDLASLILKKEIESSFPYVKRWINDLRKIKFIKIGILFGSVLNKGKKAGDIDVLFVVNKNNFDKLRKEVNELNKLSDKKVNVVYQTEEDFINNLKKQDKVILEIVKGIVFFGEREFINFLGGLK